MGSRCVPDPKQSGTQDSLDVAALQIHLQSCWGEGDEGERKVEKER